MNREETTNELPSIWQNSALRPYLGEVNRRHGVVDTLALPNMRDLPPLRIEKLFVQPDLTQHWVSPLSDPADWPSGTGLLSSLISMPALVLLGDPGSGKTTLLNWLAWRLSAGSTQDLPAPLNNRLPIACVLREMKAEVFNENTSICDLAIWVAKRLLGNNLNEALEASLRTCIANHQYILLLDGVDEISLAQRKVVALWMQQATQAGAYVVATSRLVGYSDYPIHMPFTKDNADKLPHATSQSTEPLSIDKDTDKKEIVWPSKLSRGMLVSKAWQISTQNHWAQLRYLMPFDQKRIAAFVGNWYLQRSGSETEAKQKAIDLLDALKQSAQTLELARTPNLLNLIAIVHRERAHLPDGRALLYKEIANAYINTIDQHRKITIDDALAPFDWETREGWLALVGFNMQLMREKTGEHSDSGVLVDKATVLTWLTQAMETSSVTDAANNAAIFLDWVARRSGLLLPRGENLYAFVHLSFQEYFCARYLAARIMSPKFIKDKIEADAPVTKQNLKRWCGNTTWRESLVYLLELISAERDADWLEDLTEILFGDQQDETEFSRATAGLAARIILNKHIFLTKPWEQSLALRSCYTDDSVVQNCLIQKGYAYVFSSRQDDLPFYGSNLICSDLNSPADIVNPSDVYRLIVAGKHIENIPGLAHLNNLRVLEIRDTQIQDLTAIAELKELRNLELNGTQVNDISVLKNLNKLNYVNLSNTKVCDISSLATLKKIRHLLCCNTEIKDLTALSGLKNLTFLDLSDTKVQDIWALEKLQRLDYLMLSNTHIHDLTPLAQLKNLFDLSIANTQVDDLTPLARLKNLFDLSIANTQIDDLTPLKQLKNLEFLNIANTQVSDVSALATLTNLYFLDVRNTKVKDFSVLANLKNLTIEGMKNQDADGA